jgi:hypothetical protein
MAISAIRVFPEDVGELTIKLVPAAAPALMAFS